jgi:hypothetical protein
MRRVVLALLLIVSLIAICNAKHGEHKHHHHHRQSVVQGREEWIGFVEGYVTQYCVYCVFTTI